MINVNANATVKVSARGFLGFSVLDNQPVKLALMHLYTWDRSGRHSLRQSSEFNDLVSTVFTGYCHTISQPVLLFFMATDYISTKDLWIL